MNKAILSKTLTYTVLVISSLIMLLPFIWMLSTSIKAGNEVMKMPPVWIPSEIRWDNYTRAMEMAPFDRYFLNSVIVTVVSTLGEVCTSILAAFAFSRLSFYGRDVIFAIFLGTMMVPSEMLIIPNFVTLSELGWIDQYEALIVPWLASVFAIFLLRQYFLGIPWELYYSARIDGSGDWRFLWRIMVPLAKPAIITVALLKTINSWNALLWPLIVTNSREMRTLPVGLTSFMTEAGTIYELFMAASTITILPMVIVYFFMQRHIIEGISRTGIKG